MYLILEPLAVFKQRIIAGAGIYSLAVNANKNVESWWWGAKSCGNNGALQGDMFTGGGVETTNTFSCTDILSYSFKSYFWVSKEVADVSDMTPDSTLL